MLAARLARIVLEDLFETLAEAPIERRNLGKVDGLRREPRGELQDLVCHQPLEGLLDPETGVHPLRQRRHRVQEVGEGHLPAWPHLRLEGHGHVGLEDVAHSRYPALVREGGELLHGNRRRLQRVASQRVVAEYEPDVGRDLVRFVI